MQEKFPYGKDQAAQPRVFGALSGRSTKSAILTGQLDPSVFVIGTAFEEQSLYSKRVGVIFSNPPYSVYEDWTVKIIREAAAPLVYLP